MKQLNPILTNRTVEEGVDPFKVEVVIIFRRIFNSDYEVCSIQVQVLYTSREVPVYNKAFLLVWYTTNVQLHKSH